MNLLIVGQAKTLTALNASVKRHGAPKNVYAKFYEITPKLFDVGLITADLYSYMEKCDAVIVWGTWGSTSIDRDWDEQKVIKKDQTDVLKKMAFMDLVNRLIVALAKANNTPVISTETATFSRIRANYLNPSEYDAKKRIRPRYLRMGLGHWVYGQAQWCKPDDSQYRLEKFCENFKLNYDINYSYLDHEWRNNPRGRIYVLGQLESDPTSTKNVEKWLVESVTQIREHTNRAIAFKPHPLSKIDYNQICKKLKISRIDNRVLVKNLYPKMYAAVVDNSTSVFELIDAGIPVFCDKSSFAAELGNTNLENITDPYLASPEEYQTWANKMAHTEFELEEFYQPKIFEYIQELINIYHEENTCIV